MNQELIRRTWDRPAITHLEGRCVTIDRVDPDRDVAELYEVSHGSAEIEELWRYMAYGPFAGAEAMRTWLESIRDSRDPVFYSVKSRDHNRRVGMAAVMNIAPEMGRAELGNIWYGPLVQRTRVNTEVTFLLLSELFDRLGYRRVEWKCDSLNEPSRRAALRMGFKYEGLFRQHLIVKGKNRDTAWYSVIDSEWPQLKANFEKFLSSDGVSLSQLNSGIAGEQAVES